MNNDDRRIDQLHADLAGVLYLHASWLELRHWRAACENIGLGYLPEDDPRSEATRTQNTEKTR